MPTITRTRQPSPPEAKVRRLHALGWSDAKIARNLGYTAQVMSLFMRRKGLPSNHGKTPSARESLARNASKGGEALKKKREEEAARLGWPGLTPFEARTMNELGRYSHTRTELAEKLKIRKSSVERILDRLIRRGLVEPGKGCWNRLYHALRTNLGPEIMKILNYGRQSNVDAS